MGPVTSGKKISETELMPSKPYSGNDISSQVGAGLKIRIAADKLSSPVPL